MIRRKRTMDDLKSTVDMMISDDYKERFKAEYHQLVIRLFSKGFEKFS